MQGINSSSSLQEAHPVIPPAVDGNTSEEAVTGSINTLPPAANLLKVAEAARKKHLKNLPSITQEKFDEIVNDAVRKNPDHRNEIDLGKLLADNAYAKKISNVSFSADNGLSLQGMKLDGLTFDKCTFNWSHLSASRMSSCTFTACEMSNVSFMNARLSTCTFENCQLNQAMFVNAQLHGAKFINSMIACSSFEDATITDRSVFDNVNMPATHFFAASISRSNIRHSDLTDTVFFTDHDDAEHGFHFDKQSSDSAKVTKSMIATLVFTETRGISVPLVGKKIADVVDAIPLLLAMQTPTVKKEELDGEIEAFLNNAKRDASNPLPIPQQLLKAIQEDDAEGKKFVNAARIFNKTRLLAKHVDAIVLPGGEDVSPMLYGERAHEKTDWKGDYRRSMMELGLIHQAFHRGIPFMAICRGFQMTSVYFGAKLEQHIGGRQVGVQLLGESAVSESNEEEHPRGIFGAIKQNIRVAVYHHQALPVENSMQHLGAAFTHTITDEHETRREVMMAIEPIIPSVPMMGVQFHPEFLRSDSLNKDRSVLSNAELVELAHPEPHQSGLRNPADMVSSGILEHMSSGNDELWKVLAVASDMRRKKKEISASALASGKTELTGNPASAYSNEIATLDPRWKSLKRVLEIAGHAIPDGA